MEEVILKPQWSYFEIEDSHNIANFFRVQKIDHNVTQIPLDDLREFYRLDKMEGAILTDELSLRGFNFYSERSNGFFPIECIPKKIIRVKIENKERYKKINFYLLGLGNFITKYKVNNDMFFDYIPIEGFLRINNYIRKEMLENEFINAGFDIINLSEKKVGIFDIIRESEFPKLSVTMKKKGICSIKDYCINIYAIISETSNLNKYDIQRLKLINNWFDEKFDFKDLTDIEILEYFNHNDKVFLNYCENNNITKVKQLVNDDNIKEFSKYTAVYINTFIDYLRFYYFTKLEDSIKNVLVSNIPYIGTKNTIDVLISNNINKLKDVLISDLNNLDGIGKGKIKSIYIAIFYFIENPTLEEGTSNIAIPNILYNIKIDDLITYCGLGVSSFIDYCKKNKYIYIRDLVDVDIHKALESINMLGKIKSNEIISLLTNEKYNVHSQEELIKVLASDFKINNSELYSIVYDRVIYNKTLEEVGNARNVTRERIRQVEAKAYRMLRIFADILLDYLSENKKCVVIALDTLNDVICDDDYSRIIYNIIKYDLKILYVEKMEKLFVKKNCNNAEQLFVDLNKFLDGSKEDSKDILSTDEINNYIINIIQEHELENYVELSDFAGVLEMSNYKTVGDIWLKKGVYVRDIYLNILKDYYPNGVKFDDENCEDIRKKYFDITGEKTDISNRNLTAKLQREKDVIICGSNSYIHIDNVKLPQRMLDTLKKYIIYLFEHENISSVYTGKVYNVFKEELNYYDVDSYVYLYGILRYYFIENFDFNNYWITKNGKSEVTRDLALLDYLKKDINYNVGVPKEKIISLFGLTGPYLINIITCSDEIKECHNKENLIYVGNYKLSDNLKNKIINYVNENIVKQFGFVSVKHLLSKFDIYLEEEGIVDEFTLNAVLEIYLNDFHVKELYVCKNKVDVHLDEYYFFDLFINETKYFTRRDFEQFAKEKGIYNNRIYDVLKNKFYDLYQINITDFVSNLFISNEQIDRIYSIIDENMNNRDYLLLSDLKKNGDIYKMPNLGYSWNEYLLRTILIKNMKNEYVLIDIPGAMLFTERGVLVKKSLQLNNYIDFLKYVYMMNRYYELESVNQLFKTLQAIGLINDTLPTEFKKIVVDEYGRLIRC